MNSKIGDPNNLQTRAASLMDVSSEMQEAADNLYYAAKLLTFFSHGSASRVAGLADQIVQELQTLSIKN